MCIQHSFLAHAIVALASLYVTDEDAIKYGYKSKQELSEWHAGIARQASRQSVDDISSKLIIHAITSYATLTVLVASIQANLILTLHELLSWKSLKAWVLAGIAIRHAQALRLGSEFNDRLSTRQKEIHRRTFWACFLMDRLLSYCCSRPQMIDLDTVRINLPCPESSFAFEEQYDGPSLKSFNPATSEVSRTGIAPFFIAFLSLWGKTGYFMVAHGRTATKEAPSDTHGTFWQLDQKLNDFYNALPPNIRWSNSNFKLYRSTGQAKLFVTFHLLLNHARVLLHQEYLPQLDSPGLEEAEATIHNSAERALDSNNRTISICVSSAEGIADIVSTLSSHGLSKPVELQSAFGANAMIAAAGVQMWIQHTEGSSEEMIDVAKYRIQQVSHEIRSWQSEWPVAVAWGDTLKSLGQLYDTFYTQSCNPASILTEIPDRETAEALSNCGEVSVQATERPSQGVSEGNGVPHPDSVCQRLFDKIRFVMLASLENPDVKKRMLKSYLRTLWQHMWLYEAVQGEYRATSLENLCWDDDWMNAIDMDGNL
ncbi:uncharacterized protein A1O9_04667 [Exophiala aquamarina CBS 119918]|uniref:Xylanolytic transcriptional activator regulatory domain-containing protein n=1 Tax=Exophiala aquamarina CBS 119918 TaxID=1182545 RepID=A0A072PIA6_9EURO|nr:uncharacterized protein A1O9_04667 [Exophiala aquamarina CBS 119918]KEF59819.1 hypothetical protein A1O9_04667 [Exophiala aquamarina CBS 119918]